MLFFGDQVIVAVELKGWFHFGWLSITFPLSFQSFLHPTSLLYLFILPLSTSLWCFAALSDLLNGSPAAFSFLWTMLILSLRGGDRKQPVYYTPSSAEVMNTHINCSSSVLISFLFLKRSLIFNTDLIMMLCLPWFVIMHTAITLKASVLNTMQFYWLYVVCFFQHRRSQDR